MTAVLTEQKAPDTRVPSPPATSRAHLAGLDGLRGLAVLLVVAYHALPERVPGGFVGVDVFFVLSGFLITALLLRERHENGRVHLGQFWMRRIRRLVPALLVLLPVVVALTLVVGRDTGSGLRSQVVGALTWTSNWIQIGQGWSYSDQHLPPLLNHLWSLGIEEQFYLLWPLLLLGGVVVLKRRRTFWVTAVLAAASVAMMATWYLLGDANRAYMGLDSHAFGLLMGAALALSTAPHLLNGRPEDQMPTIGATHRRTVIGLAGLAVVIAFAALVPWDGDVTFLGGLGLASLAALALIHATANPGPVATVLGWAPLRWIGERSYGLYLWHWPLIVFAVRLAPAEHAELAASVAVVVAVAVAALSYRYVERPMCRRGIVTTLRDWRFALRRPGRGGLTGPRLVATTSVIALVLSGAALAQAPADSEVESLIKVGQEVVLESADDLEKVSPETEPPADDAPAPAPDPYACQAVPGDAPVTAFGDSVTVATAPALLARRPGSAAVATVGWQYSDVANALRQAAAAGQLQPTVVIATGTNGVVDQADLDSLVRNELAGRQVALVMPSIPGRSWAGQAQEAIRAVANAYPHVHLVDWTGLAAAHPEVVAADRVHPSLQGQSVFVDLVGNALATC